MVAEPIERVDRRIRSYGRSEAVVAFSGGVDSSVVLAIAVRTLGTAAVTAVTGVSASYPAGELDQARALAESLHVRQEMVETHELELPRYARNNVMRCFHCKTELYGLLQHVAGRAPGQAVVMAGTNADDTREFRPGLLAADRFGIRSPLLDEGIDKSTVRSIARDLNLAVAEKPALACLSSRVAYGLRISPQLLKRIDRAEIAVRSLGFASVRVRHLGAVARIEVGTPGVSRLTGHPEFARLVDRLRALGWDRIEVDPAGYRAGSLNQGVRLGPGFERAMGRLR